MSMTKRQFRVTDQTDILSYLSRLIEDVTTAQKPTQSSQPDPGDYCPGSTKPHRRQSRSCLTTSTPYIAVASPNSPLSMAEVMAAASAPPPPASKKSLKAAHHLTSGALSGLTSAVCLQPLDLLKTRLQQGYNVGRKR